MDAALRQPPESTSVDQVGWQPSYSRVTVEQFLEEATLACNRLESELESVRARMERARERHRADEEALSARLHDLTAEAADRLARLEVDHRRTLERLRTEARGELDRIRQGGRHRD